MKIIAIRAILMVFAFLVPVRKKNELAGKNSAGKNRELVRNYLYGKRGIEIGASGKAYGLVNQRGAYANVDIIDAETRARNKGWKDSQLVNILSSGDDLPFKDGVFDYVFSSHVIEHFFDPIRAIKEWLRVTREGGHIFMIIPHRERTYDKKRGITDHHELGERHRQALSIRDYARRSREEKARHETASDKDHHRLVRQGPPPEGWEKYNEPDYDHHWSVWDTQAFLELCRHHNWQVVEHKDIEGYTGNDFTVILRK